MIALAAIVGVTAGRMARMDCELEKPNYNCRGIEATFGEDVLQLGGEAVVNTVLNPAQSFVRGRSLPWGTPQS